MLVLCPLFVSSFSIIIRNLYHYLTILIGLHMSLRMLIRLMPLPAAVHNLEEYAGFEEYARRHGMQIGLLTPVIFAANAASHAGQSMLLREISPGTTPANADLGRAAAGHRPAGCNTQQKTNALRRPRLPPGTWPKTTVTRASPIYSRFSVL